MGGKNRYSDAILLRLIEAMDPAFRPHKVVEQRPAFDPRDIDALSPDARAKLEAFLEQLELDQARPARLEPPAEINE